LKYWEVFCINKKTWGDYEEELKKDAKKQEPKDYKNYKIQNADKIRLKCNVFRNLWLEPSDEPVPGNRKIEDLDFGLSRCKASFWSHKCDGIDERSWDGQFYANCIRISHAN